MKPAVSPQTEVVSEEDFVASGEVSISGSVRASSSEGASLGPLQRYRIVAPLGKGGMAEVFLAAWEVAPRVQRPVVIKRLYTHLGDDSNLVQMFIDEARLACGFEHENIVKTIEVGVIDGQCCIAMEYLAGQSLQQLLRYSWAQGGVPIDVAVYIITRALDALDYAHEFKDHRGMQLGIVHRDISPHNVFITNNGQVKLLDFGIAKAKSQESRTATGYVKGKLAYIAPEQAQAKPVDRRADVWSIGVVLWEMLVGTRLFRAETDAATLNATLGAPIAKPSTKRSEIDPELDRIVMRALRRDWHARYQSAEGMKRDLEQYAVRTGLNADASSVSHLMMECFATEITQQRRQIFELLESDDAGAPVSVRTSTSVSIQDSKIQSEAALALDLTRVDGLLDQVSRSHKFLVRMLLGALMFVTALAFFVIVTLVMRQERRVTERPSASSQAPIHETASVPAHDGQPRRPEWNTSTVPEAANVAPLAAPYANAAPERSALLNRDLSQAPSPSLALHSAVANKKSAAYRAPVAAISTPPEMGTLNLDTTPWSLVTMNGRTLGQTPLMGVKLPAGTHLLTLRNPDLGIETQYSVTIEAGQSLARRIGLQ
jgi:eukaryotic-like serine/threonine-protein kinase